MKNKQRISCALAVGLFAYLGAVGPALASGSLEGELKASPFYRHGAVLIGGGGARM